MINNKYVIRSRAPLRLGFAGGGTDIPSFFENYGTGCVLNLAIGLYSFCILTPTGNNKIVFKSEDKKEIFEIDVTDYIEPKGGLELHKAAYNRIVKDYNNGNPIGGFELATYSEVPSGSGLGGSSTVMVSIINAFKDLLHLPLGDYDLAQFAYKIEREDLGLKGGKQDQYSAAFGGVNFIEFFPDNKVIVNPLKIPDWILLELEQSLILYFTGTSRDSGNIIEQQSLNLENKMSSTLDAMNIIRDEAYVMKEGLLTWNINLIKQSMQRSWEAKKASANKISNTAINSIYEKIMSMGAHCAKISGAGGGGFMMILADPAKKIDILGELAKEDGYVLPCHFAKKGAVTWRIKQ